MQLRAQANVLKKALLEEQTKGGQLKETIRGKEVELRRSEQEVDSLTFRNKQLQQRVGHLQDELEKQGKQKRNLLQLQKSSHQGSSSNGNNNNLNSVNNNNNNNNPVSAKSHDILVAEEFQKKIVENAQLISLLADKSNELQVCQQSLQELEERVNSQLFQQNYRFVYLPVYNLNSRVHVTIISREEGLRHEIQQMCAKNAELEMRLLEAGRTTISDEDNRSVTTDNSSILADTAPSEDRVLSLERELNVLRAKYELMQLQEQPNQGMMADGESPPQKGEGLPVEEILYEHFSKKIEDILLEKQLAESKLMSYLSECDNLKGHVEVLTDELRDQERQLSETQYKVKTVEDHLQTTRLKYGEQISVMTEQIVSLSDQLAAASN